MGYEIPDEYITHVRQGVFREINQRGEKDPTSINCVGWGTTSATLILKKQIYNEILDTYSELLDQIKDVDDDQYEYLFCGEEEEEEEEVLDELETRVPPAPKDSFAMNAHKRKRQTDEFTKYMKQPQNQPLTTTNHPSIIKEWYQYTNKKLKAGHLTDIPKIYRNQPEMPAIDAFMNTDMGDVLTKFTLFIRKQFM